MLSFLYKDKKDKSLTQQAIESLGDPPKFPTYPYATFNRRARSQGIPWDKTYKDMTEGDHEFVSMIFEHRNNLFVPLLLGKNEEGKTKVIEFRESHALVCGRMGSGKTSYLKGALIFLAHFSHPEYTKIVLCDPKKSGFQSFKHITTFAFEFEHICQTVEKMHEEMKRRIERTTNSRTTDAKAANRAAYQLREKALLMPYIFCVFDEIPFFVSTCKREKRKDIIMKLSELLSVGRSLGFSLILSAQAPYSEFLKGDMKNNLAERISFTLTDHQQDMLALGTREKGQLRATRLKQRTFLYATQGERQKYQTFPTSEKSIEKATENLALGGFDFRLF